MLLARLARAVCLGIAMLTGGVAAMMPGTMAHADRITVFAAASLRNALDEIAAGFAARTGHRVRLSYAGSSALARQIERGAPADVFISANLDWMDRLEAAALIAPGTRIDLARNTLVLIAHGPAAPVTLDPGFDLAGLIGQSRLAMALVDAVPAGIYGKAALSTLGLWPSVADRVAQADNVRAALALVALGQASHGVVYATDAAVEPRVSVIATFAPDTHPPIVYPAAILAGRDTAPVRDFVTWLRSDAARAILAAQGFGAGS